MKIHHIGYLADDIENAAKEFENLGFSRIGEVVEDPSREVFILFLDNDGYVVELVQPTGMTSPIYGLRKKYRNSPYHICYATDNLESAIDRLCKQDGCTLMQPPSPAPGIPSCPDVAFLMNRHIGMIELVEVK